MQNPSSTATPPATPPPVTITRAALRRDPNIRWLMIGGAASQLGDQFTLVALPWALLQLTTDPLALGALLATIGIPRAVFILVGGALVDRHSPRRVLMLTKHANTLLLGALALLMWTGGITLGLLFALALGIGLAAAFSVPAATSILPQVVAPQQLPAANALMMGLRPMAMFAGPILAGLLIASGNSASAPSRGLALAFAVDALSFVFSAWTLSRVSVRPLPPAPRHPVLAAVAAGLRSCWADRDLRTFLLYGALVNVLIAGPLQTALPLLASSTPALGTAGYGVMLGAHGAGTLLGLTIAGMRPHWRIGTLGLTLLSFDAIVGLLFIPMGWIAAAWQGAGLLLGVGLLGGYMQVLLFTWLQRRVAPAMMGRTMSLFMFVFVGLAPLSAAAAGGLLRVVPLQAVFAGTGALLVGIVVLAAAGSRMRRLVDPPMPQRPAA